MPQLTLRTLVPLVCGLFLLPPEAFGETGSAIGIPGITVIAAGGVHQNQDPKATGPCASARIVEPVHGYLRNTTPSIAGALRLGADLVQVDVRVSSDGVPVLYGEDELGCRTNGDGLLGKTPWSTLRTLDVGASLRTRDGSAPLKCDPEKPGFEKCQLAARMPRLVDALERLGKDGLVLSLPESVTDPRPVIAVVENALASGTVRPEKLLVTSPHPQVLSLWRERLPTVRTSGMGAADGERCIKRYIEESVFPESCHGGLFILRLGDFKTLGITAITLVRDIHEAGGLIHVAGVDTRQDLDYVARFPIDAVWTNQIQDLTPRLR